MTVRATILAVDDDKLGLSLIQHYTDTFDIRTVIASSAAEALAILQQQDDLIDLVLLDIAMPHVNGFELAYRIREELGLTDLPLIALTARVDPDVYVQAQEAGIATVVNKPFNPGVLKQIIEDYLGLA